MLNVLFRRAALPARARSIGLLACAWMTWMPTAHAAGAQASEAAAPTPTPFGHYQGWRDEPLQDWRAANERVGEIGGWRTYLREAQPGAGGEEGGHGRHGNHER